MAFVVNRVRRIWKGVNIEGMTTKGIKYDEACVSKFVEAHGGRPLSFQESVQMDVACQVPLKWWESR